MGHRKLPFGYRIEMGEIVRHPQEAGLVEYLFQRYLAGAAYSTLVAELRNQPILYYEGKLWNKNMVARILEDRRYTGENGFPVIVQPETLARVLEKRSAKQVPSQKTGAQKVLRRFSGQIPTGQMEPRVRNLLNRLAGKPERIRPPLAVRANPAEERLLQRELDAIMEKQPVDEAAAKERIRAIAAAQYCGIGSGEYETERLRRAFARLSPMAELDAEFLQSVVSGIRFCGGEPMEIRLKNGQIIREGEA